MNFEKIINNYENKEYPQNIVELSGNIPIVITSIHSMNQVKEGGSIKLREPYTKAITEYLHDKTGAAALIKTKDNGKDPNHIEVENFKKVLIDYINKNDIKLVLDIHGASSERTFDIELGNMNNLSSDYSTINELKEAFYESGINNISFNDPFKGGLLTQTLYFGTDVEVIQIEINRNYRVNMNNLEKVCNALTKFIYQYSEAQKNVNN